MNDQDLKFTLNYAISLIIVLTMCVYLMKSVPTLHPVLVIVIGLVVAYLFVTLINYTMPSFSSTTSNVSQYVEYSLYSNLNDLGYFNIWPPVLVVLLLFIILLYNGQIRMSVPNVVNRKN
jgi:hypothetical protein